MSSQAQPLLPHTRTEVNATGTRWQSLDIHVHSPASFDFGGLDDNDESVPKPTFQTWLKAIIESGLDGIAITDHNTGGGIDLAREALEDLRLVGTGDNFVIFPGVEITAHDGFHILAIFDPSRPASVIDTLLAQIGYDGVKGSSTTTADATPQVIAEKVAALGGLCIPAHADGKRGIFDLDQRELTKYREKNTFAAIEITSDAPSSKLDNIGLPSMLGSDMHHLAEPTETLYAPGTDEPIIPKFPGSHFTWLKVEDLNIAGLRLALSDPEQSIRRGTRDGESPVNPSQDHIKTLYIEHKGERAEYDFSQWMTCLIGGRGVGKSTVIELLRLALGRHPELRGGIADELSRFSPDAAPRERWWTNDTRIEVELLRGGMKYRAVWSGQAPNEHTIERLQDEGWVEQTGAIADRLPVRVYSQKQIFQMANENQSFLRILDEMPEVSKREWQKGHDALTSNFRGMREQLRQLLAKEAEVSSLQGKLEDLGGRMTAFDTLAATDEFREYTELHGKIDSVIQLEATAQRAEIDILEITSRLAALDTSGPGDEYRERAQSIARAESLLTHAAEELSRTRESWVASEATDKWRTRQEELGDWLQQGSSSTMNSQGIAEIKKTALEVESQLKLLKEEIASSATLKDQLDSDLLAIRESMNSLHARRKAYAERLRSDFSSTEVKIHHGAQLNSLEADLRRIFQRPDAYDNIFGPEGLPSFFVEHNLRNPKNSSKVGEFREGLIELVEKGPDSTFAKAYRIPKKFYNHLDALDTFDLVTDILLWFPEDLLEVRYRPHPGASLVPVDRGSPGQKTAALLAVILRMGDEPLLLDQPEDDLENKLINSLVVGALRDIKDSRQVIVATHNANIVVTSGAEHILAFSHGEMPILEQSGSLQTDSVRSEVCDIVEGGEEAIRVRFDRLVNSAQVS